MATHWDDWGHPLRPNPSEVQTYKKFVIPGSTLLLGATVELMPLTNVYADRSNGMDWFDLPYEDASFDTIIGDGVLIVAGPTVLPPLMRLLRPGGSLVLRTFLRNTNTKLSSNFNIRKFQGVLEEYEPVQSIYDRMGDHPTTRDYNGSPDVYYFPNEVYSLRPSMSLYPDYEYGEFYPILIWTA